MKIRSSLLLLLLVLLGLFMGFAPVSAQTAQIRAINLSPDALEADVYFGDTITPAVATLSFANASAVMPIASGATRVIVTPAGIPVLRDIDTTMSVMANRLTNVFMVGSILNIEALAINFNTSNQAHQDSAYIRMLHASPDAGDIDITIELAGGSLIRFDSIAFKDRTMFTALPKGPVTFTVFEAGGTEPIYTVTTVLDGGAYGTVIASGFATDFRLLLLNESDSLAQQPLREIAPIVEAGMAQLRAVHAVPDGPAIDIFIDTSRAVTDLGFRHASQLVALDTGAINIRIGIAGQPIDNAVISNSITFNPDTAYTVVAVGSLIAGSLDGLVLTRPMDLRAAAGQTLVRVLHASPDANIIDIQIFSGVQDDTLLNDIPFKGVTDYMTLAAGGVFVNVTTASGTLFYTAVGAIPGGTALTLMTTGSVEAGTFGINVLRDDQQSAQIPMMELAPIENDAAMRLVHVADDGGPVDVYLNNGLEALPLAFREASGISELPSDTVNIKVAPQGAGVGGAVIDLDIVLTPNTLSTVFGMGSTVAGTFTIITLVSTDADVPASQDSTSVRLLHASPNVGDLDVVLTPSDNTPIEFGPLTFGSSTPYTLVPSGNLKAGISVDGAPTKLLNVAGEIPGGGVVTLVISGSVEAANMGVNVLVDSRDGEQRPMALMLPFSSVYANNSGTTAITIAPNPVSDRGVISYASSEQPAVRLELYDAIGRLVVVRDIDGGQQSVVLDTEGLSSGVYNAVLVARNGTSVATGRVVVVQ